MAGKPREREPTSLGIRETQLEITIGFQTENSKRGGGGTAPWGMMCSVWNMSITRGPAASLADLGRAETDAHVHEKQVQTL